MAADSISAASSIATQSTSTKIYRFESGDELTLEAYFEQKKVRSSNLDILLFISVFDRLFLFSVGPH